MFWRVFPCGFIELRVWRGLACARNCALARKAKPRRCRATAVHTLREVKAHGCIAVYWRAREMKRLEGRMENLPNQFDRARVLARANGDLGRSLFRVIFT